jgi:hypothetical protein
MTLDLAPIRQRIQEAGASTSRPQSYLAAQIWLDLNSLISEVERQDAELRAAREVINQISVLLDTSPIGPTRADLAMLAFQIRQIIDAVRGEAS